MEDMVPKSEGKAKDSVQNLNEKEAFIRSKQNITKLLWIVSPTLWHWMLDNLFTNDVETWCKSDVAVYNDTEDTKDWL